jgi:hypothetical protein
VFRAWSVIWVLGFRGWLKVCDRENVVNSLVLGNVQLICKPAISLENRKGPIVLLGNLLALNRWQLVSLVKPNICLFSDFKKKGLPGFVVLCFCRYLTYSNSIRYLNPILWDSRELPEQVGTEEVDGIVYYKSIQGFIRSFSDGSGKGIIQGEL